MWDIVRTLYSQRKSGRQRPQMQVHAIFGCKRRDELAGTTCSESADSGSMHSNRADRWSLLPVILAMALAQKETILVFDLMKKSHGTMPVFIDLLPVTFVIRVFDTLEKANFVHFRRILDTSDTSAMIRVCLHEQPLPRSLFSSAGKKEGITCGQVWSLRGNEGKGHGRININSLQCYCRKKSNENGSQLTCWYRPSKYSNVLIC